MTHKTADDLDRMIDEALDAEERALLAQIGEEPGYFTQVWGLFANTLTESLGLTYNIGPQFIVLKKDDGTRRTVVDLEYVATLTGAVTERVSLFGEVFGSAPLSEGRRDRHTIQGGFTALLTRNTQIDARVGAGLVENVADWLLGVGFSIRLPR